MIDNAGPGETRYETLILMHGFHTALEVLAWLVAAAWSLKLGEAAIGFPQIPRLWDPEFDDVPQDPPRLVVIVPGRNEEANIRSCILSLLAQDYPNLRIVAVNDRSTDRTGTILEELAAADTTSKLRAIHISDLPPGWLGKTHAMALAARRAIELHSPEYLLFTDADIEFAPQAVRRSVAAAIRTRADHFVTLPTTISKSHGESAVLACLQVLGMWAVRTWRVADPEAKRDAIGVGAFNLVRTEAYKELGGFEALRMEVLEDLTLGRLMKRRGFRQAVGIAPGLVSVHWAAGVFGIVRGMTKNFFAVFEYRLWVLLLATLATALVCIGPAFFLAIPGARLPGLLAWACAAGVYAVSGRVSRLSVNYAALMPVGAAIVVWAMLRSALITLARGGVNWRGTFYPLKELRDHHAERHNWAAGTPEDSFEGTRVEL